MLRKALLVPLPANNLIIPTSLSTARFYCTQGLKKAETNEKQPATQTLKSYQEIDKYRAAKVQYIHDSCMDIFRIFRFFQIIFSPFSNYKNFFLVNIFLAYSWNCLIKIIIKLELIQFYY